MSKDARAKIEIPVNKPSALSSIVQVKGIQVTPEAIDPTAVEFANSLNPTSIFSVFPTLKETALPEAIVKGL